MNVERISRTGKENWQFGGPVVGQDDLDLVNIDADTVYRATLQDEQEVTFQLLPQPEFLFAVQVDVGDDGDLTERLTDAAVEIYEYLGSASRVGEPVL